MIRLLISVLLLFTVTAYGQVISAEEASRLTNALPIDKNDTVQIGNLLKLAKYHVFKKGENRSDLDSAAELITNAEDINNIIRSQWASGYILLTRSYWLKESGHRDDAKESANKALTILVKETDKNLLGEVYGEVAGYFDYNNSEALEERIKLTKSAITCYNLAGNVQQKAANLQMLGDLYKIKGSNYAALQQLKLALDAYNSINYKQVQGIYCQMGFVYTRLRDYPQALDKELLALKIAETVGDSSMQLCEIYNYLGEIHFALTEKQTAINYYSKALSVAKRHNDVYSIYLTSTNIANVWASLGHPDKALQLINSIISRYKYPNNDNLESNIARCYINSYCQLKQFEKARPYATRLLAMINDPNTNDFEKASTYTSVIQFFISAGETEEATTYISKHNELANKLNDIYYQAVNEKLRFMLDTAKHHYETALAHLLKSSNLTESYLVHSKSKQIGELQVQFDTKQKEDAIVAQGKDIQLLTKQKLLQESQIEKGRMLRNFMIAVAGLLLLVLLLVFRGYIIKKKNNRALSEHRKQIDEQNASLQSMVHEQDKLLHEKEWLLKEIHHRVKNNLQIVMSLLNSQSAYIDSEPALIAIHDSQHRVHAMSLIHQKLYNTDNVSSIDIAVYIRELASYLNESFNTEQRIRFQFDIESLEMDVSQAVPLGLILNEAITNSIKYAFPDNRKGVISITLSQTSEHHYLLRISDNGIGILVNSDNKKAGSLGMSLMKGLTEDIEGDFSIENNKGTTINISFVQEPAIRKSDTFAASFITSN